jgi:hypothetical protein
MGLPGAEAFRAGPALLATAPDAAQYSDLVTRVADHVATSAAGGAGHGDRIPDRAGGGRRQGRHHEPASAIRFCTPCRTSRIRPATRVIAMWDGIHRTQRALSEQAAPLQPRRQVDVGRGLKSKTLDRTLVLDTIGLAHIVADDLSNMYQGCTADVANYDPWE